MTYAEIYALIDANLEDDTRIVAAKHREVEHALLDYIQASLQKSKQLIPMNVNLAFITANTDGTGLGINEMAGYALCNGQNGTPDLGGTGLIHFGVGYNDGITYGLSSRGGLSKVTLNMDQIPPHTHGLEQIKRNTGNNLGHPISFFDAGAGGLQHNKTTDSAGDGQPHENMPPYYAVAFFQKL